MKPSGLIIGGFDPSSGAGITADIRTFDRIGVYPFSIITAITYQTMDEFYGHHPLSKEQLSRQLDGILQKYPIEYVKIGMIPNMDCLDIIIHYIKKFKLKVVLDPVTISSAGKRLSADNLEINIENLLIPLAKVLTPNLKEARMYSGYQSNLKSETETEEDLKVIGYNLLNKMFESSKEPEANVEKKAVIIKSALRSGNKITDMVFFGVKNNTEIKKEIIKYEKEKIPLEGNVHGTGCVFSSAITAYLAKKHPLKESLEHSEEFFNERFQHFIEFPRGGKSIDLTWSEDEIFITNQIKEIYNHFSSIQAFSKLIPEVRTNISGALPIASTKADIAGIEGRITIIEEFPRACGDIKFGVSDHTARLLLTAREFDKSINFVMNIKYNPTLIKVLNEKTDLELHEIKREKQPNQVRSKEFSTMQWLIKESINAKGKLPDIIWDKGSPGKEPMIRLFAKSSKDIIRKLNIILDFIVSI